MTSSPPVKARTSRAATHGVGIASYVEPTGFGPFEGARVLVTDTGGVEVYLGITTMGQGHETVLAQICADSLSVPIEDVTHLPRQHRLHPRPASAPSAAGPR